MRTLVFVLFFLHIADFPQVTLKMGHNLDPRSIKEGDDVYFECEIRCNPKAFKQAWFHNVSNYLK